MLEQVPIPLSMLKTLGPFSGVSTYRKKTTCSLQLLYILHLLFVIVRDFKYSSLTCTRDICSPTEYVYIFKSYEGLSLTP